MRFTEVCLTQEKVKYHISKTLSSVFFIFFYFNVFRFFENPVLKIIFYPHNRRQKDRNVALHKNQKGR